MAEGQSCSPTVIFPDSLLEQWSTQPWQHGGITWELSKALAAWSHPQVLTKLAGGAAWASPVDSSQV